MTQQNSDDEHELVEPTPLQWKMYERQVRDMLDAMDANAEAQHNVYMNGDLSRTPRQVDVKVTGTIAGQQITIAVECKRYARPLGIGAVDQFAGKLLDLGVERGVLFALNGLTKPARERAKGAKVPKIEVGDLIVGPDHLEIDIERLFTGVGDCPNENCYTGDVLWEWWQSDNSDRLRAGSCNMCGTWGVECPECEEIITFFWGESPCICGATASLIYDRKGIEVERIAFTTPENDERIFTPTHEFAGGDQCDNELD